MPLLGTGAVREPSARLLPALVEAQAEAEPGIGTLILTAQPDGSLRATVARDGGTTLDETSILVTHALDRARQDADLIELAGNLASRSGYDPEPVLNELRIAFIVVPECRRSRPVRRRRCVSAPARRSTPPPVLSPTGSTPLWEYDGLETPTAPVAAPPTTIGIAIPIAQGVVFLIALLLAIPTSRRRRAVRELGPLESDPADTFDEDEDG